ncbi:MAG: flagellar biosynthesis anti-sigma factor FlgM [Sphingomonas sp.]|uniref:flagellar biosynthesis anti-sigma factor FlgM n=1 Tax=Sphingomonas sp. TaxID=28214 RepID=UPI0025F88E8A|nr:flagellar biosynthesis anti-sigma factor FlgM [Sphingomonas sp.]MBX3562970.1 flagellar biosynthesis anti-sigma factor FlgM [Sphingomonas sp.]
MVDPIGIKTGAVTARAVSSVNALNRVTEAGTVEKAAPVVQTAASELTANMAAKPPVDSERVAKIKKAIEDGNFPLVPSTIADRLLALKMQWNPNE